MSAVLAKTRWLENCFAADSARLKPLWLEEFSKQEFEKFTERSIPTRKEALWKYTHIAQWSEKTFVPALPRPTVLHNDDWLISLVFVNGYFNEKLSDLSLLPPGVICSSITTALQTDENLIKPYLLREFDVKRFPFAVLNSALMADGLFLWIPKDCVIVPLIHLVFFNTAQEKFIVCPRNIIIAGENSQIKILEDYSAYQAGHYFTNTVTDIHADKNACVDYYKLQNEDKTAMHIANILVQQKQDSCINTFFADYGSQLTREDLSVQLNERGASCQLNGIYHLNRDEQAIHNYISIHHAAAHCTSAMLYKGVLDKKSQAVFNGKVYVQKGAQHTAAQQANHNLLLSTEAEVNTQPELEIYTDDVQCTHGATIGQLDEEALFYLCARGIEKIDALKLLTQAFSADVLDKITDLPIRKYIQQRVGTYAEI